MVHQNAVITAPGADLPVGTQGRHRVNRTGMKSCVAGRVGQYRIDLLS